MAIYPSHLDNFAIDASARFTGDDSQVHQWIQIVCTCESRLFDLFVSDRSSVIGRCAACGAECVVYDLAMYPAAVKLPGPEQYHELESQPARPAEVIVCYEYSEPEPDVPFDRNDVTWCQIFCRDSTGQVVEVFSDETA